MVGTALEILGAALIVAAIGIALGFAAACAAGGVGCVLFGLAAER